MIGCIILVMKENYIERSFHTVTKAIHNLSNRFENIAIPIRGSYFYDILVEKQFKIFRIKIVSTTCLSPSGSYVANIRKSGGKQTRQGFDSINCDYLYIDTPENCYLIPTNMITNTRALSLSMFHEYII